jgi:hypothetical protein
MNENEEKLYFIDDLKELGMSIKLSCFSQTINHTQAYSVWLQPLLNYNEGNFPAVMNDIRIW